MKILTLLLLLCLIGGAQDLFQKNGLTLGSNVIDFLEKNPDYKKVRSPLQSNKNQSDQKLSLIKAAPLNKGIFSHHVTGAEITAFSIVRQALTNQKPTGFIPIETFINAGEEKVLRSDNLGTSSIETVHLWERNNEILAILETEKDQTYILYDSKFHTLSDFFVLAKEKERIDQGLKFLREKVGKTKETQPTQETVKEIASEGRTEKPLPNLEKIEETKRQEKQIEEQETKAEKSTSFPWWMIGLVLLLAIVFFMLKGKSKQ